MEREVRLRTVTRAAFTRSSTTLQALLKEENLDIEKIEVSFTVLEKRSNELCELNAKIVDLLLEIEGSDLEAEVMAAERYETQFIELQHRMSSVIRDNVKSVSSINCDVNTHSRKFKLPKLEFIKFSGDIKEWLPFWGQFQKIDSELEIAEEDKFQYLRQATVEGSRARDIVESFPPTGENYKKAVESLKARFGREDLLVEIYVRELLKLILSMHQDRNRLSFSALYDKLETYLRALDTLKVTSDKCASMLLPLVESCFTEDFLKAWHRNMAFSEKDDAQDRLTKLMIFLKTEVEGEERISLAMDGFGLGKHNLSGEQKKNKPHLVKEKIATAAGLLSSTTVPDLRTVCAFCQGKHLSLDCFAAQKMSLTDKQKCLREKGVCFACLRPGHMIKGCRASLRCLICSKKHVPLMCPQLRKNGSCPPDPPVNQSTGSSSEVNMTSFNYGSKVFLQTLKAKLISEGKEREIRILLDSGSQKTYILKNVAGQMGYVPIRKETIIHALFGGSTEEVQHNCYKIRLENFNGQFKCNFEALDQRVICCDVAPVEKGQWIEELKELKIHLSDVGETASQIHILVGADIMGKLLTGRREILPCGLVAVETYLGWTLMGKVPQVGTKEPNMSMVVTSLFMKEASVTDLWSLDVIGIMDPLVSKSKVEKEMQAKRLFQESIKVNEEGRYEVSLPWTDENIPLPSNKALALKRLETTTRKLNSENILSSYDGVFRNWMSSGIIERVSTEATEHEHYLPHRPVIKEQSTTKIRPVFDASAREKGSPSLNQCLECGPNLIELIPSILLKFRQFKYGVVSDIEKAFLQISITKEDRDYLRFFWWELEGDKQLKTFRHARVVFGVKCSPFLLGAVIEYHLQKCMLISPVDRIIKKLMNSFYVDNVLASLSSQEELKQFIEVSQSVMAEGKFNLRGWQHTGDEDLDTQTAALGQVWNRKEDTLCLNLAWLDNLKITTITKRIMLSVAQKVYDPFGYTAAVTLFPKLMLQKTWKLGLSWDDEVPEAFSKEFLNWFEELHVLGRIKFDRWLHITDDNLQNCTIHTFCDASKDAYATAVFLRLESESNVKISLLFAKSRVAPLKGGTIPRLELLAALVGARLTQFVVEALDWSQVPCYYWSDSTTVLAWIKRENWSVFVRNRVVEIRKLSSSSSWNHISGEFNPADLPSRGCKAKHLLAARWWEGPIWLRNPIEEWPVSFSKNVDYKEEEIEKEKMKSSILLTSNIDVQDRKWYYSYFSRYQQIVRLVGWVLRFKHNCSCADEHRIKGELTSVEFQQAERRIVKMIQEDTFTGEKVKNLKTLSVYKDDQNIFRLKTKIVNRKDHEDFKRPMILPAQHEVVEKLIIYHHQKNSHVGVQILLNLLREHYWILNGRKTVKRVLSKCVICRRHASKRFEAETSTLPESRVKDSAVFQVTGIDLAGPLYMKDNQKAWVTLFTRATYRAVNLELVTSISTESFLLALRRFISRRGRCCVIYCDNGTNFTGARNLLASLDWNRVVKHGSVNAIEFKFNPPTASWWGGFWERLIRVLKDLLKRVLGRAQLTYEELTTVLCDCESVINSRPLTHLSDSDADFQPICPSMFLQDIVEWKVPDIDAIDHQSLNRRIIYRQNLQKDLRNRFRSEYLGLLIQRAEKKKNLRQVSIGEIVLVGSDNTKRINWPLGRIVELIPGKDETVRLVRVQTSNSVLLRPIQRIYPLEVASDVKILESAKCISKKRSDSCSSSIPEDVKLESDSCSSSFTEAVKHEAGSYSSRVGRVVKIPNRLDL